ncbi:MAG TPA: lipid asymmetry maintenance ABC transporter permease subunit MlaE [Gammaproteobacteria bacterium]|nr:lipid asymmetry maintenance ABC transporter permease subunit MlaE [Gammaproteobacteria bacterium]
MKNDSARGLNRLALEIGYSLRGFLQTFGAGQIFLLRLIINSPYALARPRLIIKQVYVTGVQSLVVIMLAGLFVGMVLALQGYLTLSKFGAEDTIGMVAALGLTRELGPVVTALLFAGRAGTALSSEIGLMRATDQLSGMEMMAVDPIKRVVVPRFLGGVIAMPLLAVIFSAMGIFGAWLEGVIILGVDEGAFWSQMQAQVELGQDVMSGIIKSIFFGVAASMLAVFEGYNCVPTAEGVGRATTRAVVHTSLSVLVLNFMLTAWLLGGT